MKPNVLIIMTDQQFGGAMSCAGNDDLHTPAMDAIAARGVRFDQAYCTYPLCIPARESLMTGRMAYEVGYREWGDGIDPAFASQQMGFLFRRAGYDCVYGGKVHAPNHDPTHNGFRAICKQDDTKLALACIDYLRDEHEQPFLMVASFDNPHNICEWARHSNLPWGNIPTARTEDCPTLPANYAIPPFEPEVIRWIRPRAHNVYPTITNTPEQWRHYRNAYYRLIEKADAEIGKILDALHAQGLADNTIICFISDHGDGHGAHQWNQKSILYEESIRVPCIVSVPGQGRIGAGESRLVSVGLDMLPTLCDYAGIEPPDDLPGYSLRPLLEGEPDPTWRESLIVETWPFQGDPSKTLGRMVRTNRYKYVVYSWGRYREQLVDLERDPGEMVNLAVSARHRNLLDAHRQLLREYCQRVGDDFEKSIPTGYGCNE